MLIQLRRTDSTQRVHPLIALSILVAGSVLPLSGGLHRSPTPLPSLPQGTNLNNLPLRFEPNIGQSPASARFTARSPQALLELTLSGVHMTLQSPLESPASGV